MATKLLMNNKIGGGDQPSVIDLITKAEPINYEGYTGLTLDVKLQTVRGIMNRNPGNFHKWKIGIANVDSHLEDTTSSTDKLGEKLEISSSIGGGYTFIIYSSRMGIKNGFGKDILLNSLKNGAMTLEFVTTDGKIIK